MLLSTQLQYGADPISNAESVVAMERAGLDAVWVAEAYSFDAVTLWATSPRAPSGCRSAPGSCRSTAAPRR